MNAVNNFSQIRSLLSWKDEGDYYYCQLILRKKDGATTFGNKNNSARLINTYCFFNVEQFDMKEEEIIHLCEEFKCRAGISLNRRNERKVTLELLRQVTDRVISNNFIGINGILNSANGQKTSKDHIWLIDCDSPAEKVIVSDILADEMIKPVGEKIIDSIPTYSGFHILTRKFDVMSFNKQCQERGISVEIHKNNPVALYYPEKL